MSFKSFFEVVDAIFRGIQSVSGLYEDFCFPLTTPKDAYLHFCVQCTEPVVLIVRQWDKVRYCDHSSGDPSTLAFLCLSRVTLHLRDASTMTG